MFPLYDNSTYNKFITTLYFFITNHGYSYLSKINNYIKLNTLIRYSYSINNPYLPKFLLVVPANE